MLKTPQTRAAEERALRARIEQRKQAAEERRIGERIRRADQHDTPGWRRIGQYLRREREALLAEQRVTAFCGCRTSWRLIERAALYRTKGSGSIPEVRLARQHRFGDLHTIERFYLLTPDYS